MSEGLFGLFVGGVFGSSEPSLRRLATTLVTRTNTNTEGVRIRAWFFEEMCPFADTSCCDTLMCPFRTHVCCSCSKGGARPQPFGCVRSSWLVSVTAATRRVAAVTEFKCPRAVATPALPTVYVRFDEELVGQPHPVGMGWIPFSGHVSPPLLTSAVSGSAHAPRLEGRFVGCDRYGVTRVLLGAVGGVPPCGFAVRPVRR
jgi:hypothetical protein